MVLQQQSPHSLAFRPFDLYVSGSRKLFQQYRLQYSEAESFYLQRATDLAGCVLETTLHELLF